MVEMFPTFENDEIIQDLVNEIIILAILLDYNVHSNYKKYISDSIADWNLWIKGDNFYSIVFEYLPNGTFNGIDVYSNLEEFNEMLYFKYWKMDLKDAKNIKDILTELKLIM